MPFSFKTGSAIFFQSSTRAAVNNRTLVNGSK